MKVRDYVRTKWGYICKIVNINEFREPSMKYGVEASYLKDIMFIGDEDIIKPSPNIIDLIEVGDYVNGYRITTIGGNGIYAEDENGYLIKMFTKEDIKSIVTREMFKSMEYKVGE